MKSIKIKKKNYQRAGTAEQFFEEEPESAQI
jgi:hypothetical protein